MTRYTLIALTLGLFHLTCSGAAGADGDILEREVLAGSPGATFTVERVVYESDGLRIVGFLAYPNRAVDDSADASSDVPIEDGAAAPERLPCILYNRGGNQKFGVLTPEWAQRFGSLVCGWGYVLFASNYRGSPGSEGADEFGGADVRDVVNALRVFEHLDFADPDRIGMWGHSRGGLMTLSALRQLRNRPGLVDAAVVAAGMSDLQRSIDNRAGLVDGVYAELIPGWGSVTQEQAIADRSPLRWVEELPEDVPMLLLHGTADWRVDPRDSLEMAERLLELRRPYRLIMFEGADHSISEFREQYLQETRRWFDRYVRDGEPLPDLTPHGK